MQIVIDIPDGRYEEIMTDDIYLDVPIFKEDIIATIPKGHGRLIDADDILNQIELKGFLQQDDAHLVTIQRVKEALDEAPTIIEAESEVEK